MPVHSATFHTVIFTGVTQNKTEASTPGSITSEKDSNRSKKSNVKYEAMDLKTKGKGSKLA